LIAHVSQKARQPWYDKDGQRAETEGTKQHERSHPNQEVVVPNLILDDPNDVIAKNDQEGGRQGSRNLVEMSERPRPQEQFDLVNEISDDAQRYSPQTAEVATSLLVVVSGRYVND
tara:strand:- start:109 stop:456 length:348 start_codon:yes stop_codon:yes gene_type:complete